MNTLFTADPVRAATFVTDGKLVVFPTETVYGLGAHAFDEKAVEQVYQAKKRPTSNPLIVHIGTLTDVLHIAREVAPLAKLLMNAFFPGPLTLILPRHPSLPGIVSGGLDTVAVRMPALPLAIKFLNAACIPVVAPSANLSGCPSATTWQSAAEDLNHRVHCILCGPPSTLGLESTVVDCTSELPMLLRPGAISEEQLRTVIPEFSTTPPDEFRSPGMRYNHYAPNAKIRLIENPNDVHPNNSSGYIGLLPPPLISQFKMCRVLADKNDYSHSLFEFFRDCDRSGIKTIYCQKVDQAGIGRALMDRLIRAAKSTK
ncbi:MAG: L-threonylcarbamoyladenylate synthase [Bacteroidetes bacterium]|nr:L-threonylcarbamoyladenylate synthase [Bacteroidota bacterium]MCY4205368.1 L-threonylcarbamoyladenylate synthase [Bacteroidota bacterium]